MSHEHTFPFCRQFMSDTDDSYGLHRDFYRNVLVTAYGGPPTQFEVNPVTTQKICVICQDYIIHAYPLFRGQHEGTRIPAGPWYTHCRALGQIKDAGAFVTGPGFVTSPPGGDYNHPRHLFRSAFTTRLQGKTPSGLRGLVSRHGEAYIMTVPDKECHPEVLDLQRVAHEDRWCIWKEPTTELQKNGDEIMLKDWGFQQNGGYSLPFTTDTVLMHDVCWRALKDQIIHLPQPALQRRLLEIHEHLLKCTSQNTKVLKQETRFSWGPGPWATYYNLTRADVDRIQSIGRNVPRIMSKPPRKDNQEETKCKKVVLLPFRGWRKPRCLGCHNPTRKPKLERADVFDEGLKIGLASFEMAGCMPSVEAPSASRIEVEESPTSDPLLVPKTNPKDPFVKLPKELMWAIFSALPTKCIAALRLASRNVACIVRSPADLPQAFFATRFGPGSELGLLEEEDWPELTGAVKDWRSVFVLVMKTLKANAEDAFGGEAEGLGGLRDRMRILECALRVLEQSKKAATLKSEDLSAASVHRSLLLELAA